MEDLAIEGIGDDGGGGEAAAEFLEWVALEAIGMELKRRVVGFEDVDELALVGEKLEGGGYEPVVGAATFGAEVAEHGKSAQSVEAKVRSEAIAEE
jgi:hypothetical protein